MTVLSPLITRMRQALKHPKLAPYLGLLDHFTPPASSTEGREAARVAHSGFYPTPSAGRSDLYCSAMKGFLEDGPAAGQLVEAGDPPIRRGIIVVGHGTFGEEAHRYYLSAVNESAAVYIHGGPVPWPPEAGPVVNWGPTHHYSFRTE